MSCPNVNSKSKATLMVIEFLDKELLRLDRDKKLEKKCSTIESSSSLLSNDNNNSDIGNKDDNHNHDMRPTNNVQGITFLIFAIIAGAVIIVTSQNQTNQNSTPCCSSNQLPFSTHR